MSDILGAAMATLTGKLTSFASVPCTYTRGLLTCTVNLTAGSEMLRVTDAQGGTKIERPDLAGTFDASELVFYPAVGAVPPQDGDLIDWNGSQYRLTPQNNGKEPSWRYTDPQHTAVWIFAKFVKAL